MAIVRGGGQVPQGPKHTRSEISKLAGPAYPRDDLKAAYAGDENKGPNGSEKKDVTHSTNVKARKTKKSSGRTPIM